MARKPVTDEFSPFPHRLALLMKERGLRQQDLAQELGVKRQTVSLYTSGQSTPDALILKQIAKFFQVSADWLLGLSEIRSPNPQLSAVCDYTGLTEKAVENLRNYDMETMLPSLNRLLGEHYFTQFLVDFDYYQRFINGVTNIDPAKESSYIHLINTKRLVKYEKYKIMDTINDLLENVAPSPEWEKWETIWKENHPNWREGLPKYRCIQELEKESTNGKSTGTPE